MTRSRRNADSHAVPVAPARRNWHEKGGSFRFRLVMTPRPGVMDHPDLLRLLAAQYGVVSLPQLWSLGISRSAVWRCQRAGTVTTLLPGVLLVASHTSTFEAEAMAVQLHTAPDGVLSSTTAARLHGLRGMPTRPIRALVSRRTRSDLPSWVHKASSSWLVEDEDVTAVRGLRLLRPVRMLLTLAELFNDFRFERAAEDAWHLDLVSPEEASVFLATYRRQGRGGIARFEKWLNTVAHRKRPSQSGFELDILGAIRRAGLPEPQRQHPVTLLTSEVVHLDFAWPAVMLGVEPGHSWWHGGDLRMRADTARDRACTAVGWEVVRYGEEARADLAGVGRELRTIYERRRSMIHPA